MPEPLLEVEGLSCGWGDAVVLSDVSFTLPAGRSLALLGRNHPVGVLLAALLFGTLKNGATRMQSVAQIPVDIITIVIALVIVFIAAPEIIRALYRLPKTSAEEGPVFTKGWGS